MRIIYCLLLAAFAALPLAFAQLPAPAQKSDPNGVQNRADFGKRPPVATELADALNPSEWRRVDVGVERALAWLASQQQRDGSFPTQQDIGQPAITSLGVMAYLSAGHLPGEGKYGKTIERAIDYVLDCQKPSGIFCYLDPGSGAVNVTWAANYNHAISGLTLCEAYGQTSRERSTRIKEAIELALKETARTQHEPPKIDSRDIGGWRYLHTLSTSRSDLSITAWQLMFMRSAKNAQFDIPDEMVAAAIKYLESLYQPELGVFFYGHSSADSNNDRYASRGMMGAGILSLSLAGKHETEMARRAGDWLLKNPFNVYGYTMHRYDRFHYSAYYCSNAAAQLGGEYWRQLFPTLAKTLLDAQSPEGSWLAESEPDQRYGSCYPTALSVLALTHGYQLLPIYQR